MSPPTHIQYINGSVHVCPPTTGGMALPKAIACLWNLFPNMDAISGLEWGQGKDASWPNLALGFPGSSNLSEKKKGMGGGLSEAGGPEGKEALEM